MASHKSFTRNAGIIKGDLMPFFHDLFNGQLQLFYLNFGMITLFPKKEEAVRIEQFIQVCLINASFNFFLQKLDRTI